jgi:hypothetical protein
MNIRIGVWALLAVVLVACLATTVQTNIKEGASGAVAYYLLDLKYVDEGNENLESLKRNLSSATVVPGFDGYSLKSNVIKSMEDESAIPNIQKRYGEGGYASKAKKRNIGRYLTHFQLYKTLLTTPGAMYVVVIENTVRTTAADLEKTVLAGIKQAGNDFDVLFLSGAEGRESEYGKTCPIDPANPPTAEAYVINTKNIPKLLMATKTIEETIDVMLAKAVKEGKLKALRFCPPLVKKFGSPSK